MSSDSKQRRIGIIRAVQTPLGFFVLVVLVVEALLGTVASLSDAFDRTLTIVAMVLIIVALIGVVAFLTYARPEALSGRRTSTDKPQRKPATRETDQGSPDGLTADSPISAQNVGRWLGRWNCRWMIHVERGQLAPYVDDGITLEHIASETGIVRGIGHTAYGSGGTYKIRGRIVGGRIGIFSYSSNESAFSGMDGMFMVRMNAVGEVSGWWLGCTRDGLEIGGHISLERYKDNEPFELKLHPYPPPKVSDAS